MKDCCCCCCGFETITFQVLPFVFEEPAKEWFKIGKFSCIYTWLLNFATHASTQSLHLESSQKSVVPQKQKQQRDYSAYNNYLLFGIGSPAILYPSALFVWRRQWWWLATGVTHSCYRSTSDVAYNDACLCYLYAITYEISSENEKRNLVMLSYHEKVIAIALSLHVFHTKIKSWIHCRPTQNSILIFHNVLNNWITAWGSYE